jgi:hypothetical protein
MKKFTLLLLLLPITAMANDAWWVGFSHYPYSLSYDGIKANSYNENFSHIEIFTCDNYKIFSKAQCNDIAEGGGKFQIKGDFNNDGQNELWNIGVAKYKNGKYPYANVILIRNSENKRIIKVLTIELEEPSFAIFFHNKKSISLYFCMDCDDSADIIWIKSWELKWTGYDE